MCRDRFGLSDESLQTHLAMAVRSVLYGGRSEPFPSHAVLCEHHAALSALACGAGVRQRRCGDRVGGTAVVRAVVPVGGMGIDRFVDRGLSGECAHGFAP